MFDIVHVYDVQTKAREKLFDWVRPLPQDQYTRSFPFGRGTIRTTLTHMAAAEWFLSRWIRGEADAGAAEPPSEERQPAFADLETLWRAQAPRTRATLADVVDWNAEVETRIVRPSRLVVIRAAPRAQVATQLLLHEVHHRAQVMAMLRALGVEAQTLDYIGFVHKRREESA